MSQKAYSGEGNQHTKLGKERNYAAPLANSWLRHCFSEPCYVLQSHSISSASPVWFCITVWHYRPRLAPTEAEPAYMTFYDLTATTAHLLSPTGKNYLIRLNEIR